MPPLDELAGACYPALPDGWTNDWLKWNVGLISERATEYEVAELPYVSNEDIAPWTGKLLKEPKPEEAVDARLFKMGDVLFNKLRPYLAKVYQAEFDGLSSGELLCLRPNKTVSPRYLFYYVSSYQLIARVNAATFGTKMPRADWDIVCHQPLAMPNRDIQQRIADFLDERTTRIDGLIAKKTRLLELLAEQRQALITRAVTKGLDPSAPMKPSGIDWLGDIPADWEVKRLKLLGCLIGGAGFPHEHQGDTTQELPFYKVANLAEAGFNAQLASCENTVSRNVALLLRACIIERGDIIFAKVGAALLLNRFRQASRPCCIDNNMMALRPNSMVIPKYLLWAMSRIDFSDIANPGAVPSLGTRQIGEIKIAVPPLAEQQGIADCLDKQTAQIDHTVIKVQASIGLLREYRAALITAAVTGKIETRLPAAVTQPAARQAPAAFKRAVLAAYIADWMCDQATFGKVKFQKTLHLAEAHLGIDEVEGQYYRKAAGPFDPGMMRSVHSQLKKQGWITAEEREGNKGTQYRRGVKIDTYRTYFDRYFSDKKEAIDRLLTLMKPMKTKQAEIISTCFAAWNDLLIEGKNPSDDDIVDLILNDWDASKQNIAPERWHSALGWMRSKDIVPQKSGKHTKKKATK